jgi:hypothetical protein
LCNFLHSPVTSSLLGRNILLSTLFSNTLGLCSKILVNNGYNLRCSPLKAGRSVLCYPHSSMEISWALWYATVHHFLKRNFEITDYEFFVATISPISWNVLLQKCSANLFHSRHTIICQTHNGTPQNFASREGSMKPYTVINIYLRTTFLTCNCAGIWKQNITHAQ